MPVYCYRCPDCKLDFEKRHSMNTVLKRCIQCESENIFKIPALSLRNNSHNFTERAGKVVDTYIKDAKLEIKKHKKQLKIIK